MAITMWIHYADHALAPICRSRRGSNMPIADRIEHVADWEINRRHGVDFPLLLPTAAIPSEEAAISVTAAVMLRARFAQD